MARTQLQFAGVGVVKKKASGNFDDGKPWLSYEIAFDDCRRSFSSTMTAEEFQSAPGVGSEVRVTGHLETDAKARLVWYVDTIVLAEGAADPSVRRRAA